MAFSLQQAFALYNSYREAVAISYGGVALVSGAISGTTLDGIPTVTGVSQVPDWELIDPEDTEETSFVVYETSPATGTTTGGTPPGGTDMVQHGAYTVPWDEMFNGETWPGGPLLDDSWDHPCWDLDQSYWNTTGYPTFFFEDPQFFGTHTFPMGPLPDADAEYPEFIDVEKGYLFVPISETATAIIETTFGTAGNDLIAGSGLLLGNAGDDTLIGGTGNDYLVAGTGNNMLEGGKGADKLDGTGGWGVADYHHAATAVKVYLDGSKANVGDEAAGDTFVSINGVQGSAYADELNGNGSDNWMIGGGGNDTVKGGGGNDTLYGSDGDDQLVGGAGNDHLIGGTGNNVLEGGDGADVLDGSDGWGVADYRNADTAVTVRLDGSGNAGDEAAGDTYININGAFGSAFGDTILGNANGNWIIACEGNDTVSGGVGSDTLYGSEGNDVLNGGSENDTLFGGSGSNVLTGGSGRDVFVFDAPGSLSRITDFSVAEDKIQLDRGVFGGFGASVSLAVGSMANSGGAQIIYNSGTGDLSYDADGLGGGVAVKFALLATGLALTANNFIL